MHLCACCIKIHVCTVILHAASSGAGEPVTTFQAGSVINITYHLAYPHRVCMLTTVVTIGEITSYNDNNNNNNISITNSILFIYLFNFLQGGILVNILAPNGSIQFALLGRQWQQTRDTTYVARFGMTCKKKKSMHMHFC